MTKIIIVSDTDVCMYHNIFHTVCMYIRMSIIMRISRVAQWERAGPITQRPMDRNHPLLDFFFFLQ